MRLLSPTSLSALVGSLVCVCACDTGEPPLLDSGVDALADGTAIDTGTFDAPSTMDVTQPDVSHADGKLPDVTVADHSTPGDVVTPRDAGRDTACGDTGATCSDATTCLEGVCRVTGGAGQPCGAHGACASSTVCNAGYCTHCGGPGEACCSLGSCASGGCCLAGICTPAGSVCPYPNGGLCVSSSCQSSCGDGGCGACGGPGQNCCNTEYCTASQVDCVTTTAKTKVCEACGGAGQACCAGGGCAGGSLVCVGGDGGAGGTCAECGGAGEPICTAGDAGT